MMAILTNEQAAEYRKAAHHWQEKWQAADQELQACKLLLEEVKARVERLPCTEGVCPRCAILTLLPNAKT